MGCLLYVLVVMVFDATFNNISIYHIGGWNRSTWRKPPTCHRSLWNFITWCCIEYTPPCDL